MRISDLSKPIGQPRMDLIAFTCAAIFASPEIASTCHHPDPPPPPPPPPDEPPPPEPKELLEPSLDPGAVEADATVCDRSLPRLLAKPVGLFTQSWLPLYHAEVAAPAAAAAASTPAKRSAHVFSTSSAMA